MRKITIKLLILAVLSLLCISTEASAVGLGIFIPTVGSGNTTLEIDYPEELGLDTYSLEPDISHFGFGFVLDTKVANPGVFNYRLHIGYEKVTLNFPENQNYPWFDYNDLIDDKFSRISIDNTFGFAVLQSKIVRLWLGPQIRLSYMGFSKREVEGVNLDVDLLSIGIAPVLAANFNIGSVFTLAPELGYRISAYGGGLSLSDYDEDWALTSREFYLKLNIIFRINDYYDSFY